MTNQQMIECYKEMLQASVNGLISAGWEEKGGSDVWRILEKENNCIKIYLNNYKFPNNIVTRLS